MSQLTQCPHCQQSVSVPDGLPMGGPLQCPVCRQQFAFGDASASSGDDPLAFLGFGAASEGASHDNDAPVDDRVSHDIFGGDSLASAAPASAETPVSAAIVEPPFEQPTVDAAFAAVVVPAAETPVVAPADAAVASVAAEVLEEVAPTVTETPAAESAPAPVTSLPPAEPAVQPAPDASATPLAPMPGQPYPTPQQPGMMPPQQAPGVPYPGYPGYPAYPYPGMPPYPNMPQGQYPAAPQPPYPNMPQGQYPGQYPGMPPAQYPGYPPQGVYPGMPPQGYPGMPQPMPGYPGYPPGYGPPPGYPAWQPMPPQGYPGVPPTPQQPTPEMPTTAYGQMAPAVAPTPEFAPAATVEPQHADAGIDTAALGVGAAGEASDTGDAALAAAVPTGPRRAFRVRQEANPIRGLIGATVGGALGMLVAYHLVCLIPGIGAKSNFLNIPYLPGAKKAKAVKVVQPDAESGSKSLGTHSAFPEINPNAEKKDAKSK